MSRTWQEVPRARPDPYLEWEYRTRDPDDHRDLLCSLQIEVLPDLAGGYLGNLVALRDAVDAGKLDGDPGAHTLRMAVDEREHLVKVIDRVRHGAVIDDPVGVQFFIYRPEMLVFSDGTFSTTTIYKTIFAGPPIDELNYNHPREGARAFDFGGGHPDDTVAIGIVDDGLGFAHERFRDAPTSSRVYAIWLQEVEQAIGQDGGVLFGHRLRKRQIDKLLRECRSEDQIYRKAGVIDFRRNRYNPLASRASHGTHVLDLAAGYEHSDGQPSRPILGVQLPSVATIDTSGVTMGSYVLQAVRMLMVWADTIVRENGTPAPLVINFSYGILAGPKDGTQHLEHALARLIEFRNRKTRTALVLPAGNSYRVRTTAKVVLKGGESRELDWAALPDAAAPNFIEMWFDDVDPDCSWAPVEITLSAPDGSYAEPIRLKQGVVWLLMVGGRPIAGLCYDIECNTKRGRIFLAVGPSVRNEKNWPIAPCGRWTVSIDNKIDGEITAHWYVQRDDTPFGYPRRGRQSYLDHDKAYARDWRTGDYRLYEDDNCPLTYKDTLSAIATARCAATVVGAAEATDEFYETNHDCPPADYASSGPTISRHEPDCSAIADDGDALWGVLAAGTLSGSTVPMRGSSVAAPQIVRELADELAAGSSGDVGVPPVPHPPASKTIDVSEDDEPRLGEFVLKPASRNWIPQRRYPAI
jgi:hypothetical protein